MEGKISEEIASLLLRLVYPKSQRQVELRSDEFPPGFSLWGKSEEGDRLAARQVVASGANSLGASL